MEQRVLGQSFHQTKAQAFSVSFAAHFVFHVRHFFVTRVPLFLLLLLFLLFKPQGREEAPSIDAITGCWIG
jgi:hypothetical protein